MSWVQRINPAWFLAGAAFFLPIKPAPVNLFLLLTVLFAFIQQDSRRAIWQLFASKELIPLWLLLSFLALTFFYTTNDQQRYAEFVSKYGRLVLIPILASVLIKSQDRAVVGKGFLAGVAVILLLSYAIWFGVDPSLFGAQATDMYSIPANPTVFKSHITHNFFLVSALYLWILLLSYSNALWVKLFCTLFLVLGLVNLFGMIDGRTGWFTFAVIPLYLGYRKLGLKGFLLAGVSFAVLLIAAYFFVDNIHDRFAITWLETQQVLNDKPQQHTSIGERVIYLSASWAAFLNAPLFGYGLGGIEGAVQPFTSAVGWPSFYNPHNQFLMLMLQGGMLALLLYFWFIANAILKSSLNSWSSSYILPVLLIYCIGNILNSFHFDFAEGVGFILIMAILLGAQFDAGQSTGYKFVSDHGRSH